MGGAIAISINPPKEKEGPLPGFVDRDDAMKKMTPIFIGGGLVLAGLPFIVLNRKYFNEGVTIYNAKNASAGNYTERKIELGFTESGVGLVYRF